MDDKGEILSSSEVDENIDLQIWTKGLSPRLVICNKNQSSRKLIRLNWLENRERKLSVKGKKRGESIEYSLADLLPHFQRILSEYAVYTSFKPRLWKFAVTLEKVLHAPAIVTEKGELSLLSEEKRASLWLADLTEGKKGEGSFRPFFPLSDKEKDAIPEGCLSITENRRGVEDLFKTGVVRKLAMREPARWYRSVRVISAAMLLGFSFCEEDGGEVSDDLWREEDPGNPAKLTNATLMGLGRKFVAYVRHFAALNAVETRISLDSDKELQDQGYARKRRIEFPSGLLGDVDYSVTFFDREDRVMALGCKPRAATSRHKGELLYLFPTSIYEQALTNDSLGGAPDDYFTVAQLTTAKTFDAWVNNILPYITSFLEAL
ncbi:MAG: hypothetical protein LBD04_06450 [Synergistaceae bacterium]|jgi:hypothetical protein|nr:hypothetical protein [Synergistaceae bacterium]